MQLACGPAFRAIFQKCDGANIPPTASKSSHLLVDFHGANKSTGMDRTWPNVLTREGVRRHEHQISRYRRLLQPDHDVIPPFTRYVAGPGDYTPTVFTARELQGNTWAHELAQAIIFASPYLCFGGHPQEYLANPARGVLAAIPPTWDETRVLNGSEPGKVVGEARRSGDQWFIAVMSGVDVTSLDIPLDFLGAGLGSSGRNWFMPANLTITAILGRMIAPRGMGPPSCYRPQTALREPFLQ